MSERDRPAYCGQCGTPMQEGDRFCGNCGAAVLPSAPQAEQVVPEPSPTPPGATGSGVRQGNPRRMATFAMVGVLAVLVLGIGAVAATTLGPRMGLIGVRSRWSPRRRLRRRSPRSDSPRGTEGSTRRNRTHRQRRADRGRDARGTNRGAG